MFRAVPVLALGPALVACGHPASGSANPSEVSALARHEATFTTFCDSGAVEDGTCWCKGGASTAAIGDGTWLWHELVGARCASQPGDRCDCSTCGGGSSDCPHEGCWQCEGVDAPQCNPSDELKRCEVEVHGTHGAEKYYITEVCPSEHPCNRCKPSELQRCAAWSPLAIDLCGSTWHLVFDKTRSEARGHVTLSCYPHEYKGHGADEPGEAAEGDADAPSCYSKMAGDTKEAMCEDWCSEAFAHEHCLWCKCRGCARLAGACASVLSDLEGEARKRAALFSECGRALDCKSWCNQGNCGQCPCAECERCGPAPLLHATGAAVETGGAPAGKAVRSAPPVAASEQPAGCHGWCIVGGAEDPDVVCRSSKCASCPFCERAGAGQHRRARSDAPAPTGDGILTGKTKSK